MSSTKKRAQKNKNKHKSKSKMLQRKRLSTTSRNKTNKKSTKHNNNTGQFQTNLSWGIGILLICLIVGLLYYSKYKQNNDITIKLESVQETKTTNLLTKYDHSILNKNKHLMLSKDESTLPIPFQTKATVNKWWKHDRNDFTQGFEVFNVESSGKLIILESTGLYKESKLKFIELNDENKSPIVRQSASLKNEYFGEGCTTYIDKESGNKYIYQLTWKIGIVIVYDLEFNVIKELKLPSEMREGWGLYYDYNNDNFLATDGSSIIYYIEPNEFKVIKKLNVKLKIKKKNNKIIDLRNLNEIEIVNGWIVANVWYDKNIYIISPYNGFVYGIIQCSSIFPAAVKTSRHAVLNGIGFDHANNQLIITGKNWPKVFAIDLPEFMTDTSFTMM